MRIKKRNILRARNAKEIIEKMKKNFHYNEEFHPKKTKIEEIVLDDNTIIYKINDTPMLIEDQLNRLVPTLLSLLYGHINLPIIKVDAGAVSHVTNGASIMRPGIILIDENIKKGSFVQIIEPHHHKSIAIYPRP